MSKIYSLKKSPKVRIVSSRNVWKEIAKDKAKAEFNIELAGVLRDYKRILKRIRVLKQEYLKILGFNYD